MAKVRITIEYDMDNEAPTREDLCRELMAWRDGEVGLGDLFGSGDVPMDQHNRPQEVYANTSGETLSIDLVQE